MVFAGPIARYAKNLAAGESASTVPGSGTGAGDVVEHWDQESKSDATWIDQRQKRWYNL